MIPRFRAWDKENKRWMTPTVEDEEESEIMLDLWGNVNFRLPWYKQTEGTIATVYGNDMFYIMQSTGAKDKNNVEIYEGDIVKRTYLFNGGLGETHTGEVIYDEEYARYVISKPYKFTEPKTEDLRNTLSEKSTYEVLGNIYENHELLEVQE